MFKTLVSSLDPKAKASPEEIAKIPSYVLCRWLGGNAATIFAGNTFNLYHDIPIECQYQMIKSAFAGRVRYIPYPKATNEELPRDAALVAEHFNISDEKALEYLSFISEKELAMIRTLRT